MEKVSVNSGIYMGNSIGDGNYSVKNVIEDFMKTEYEEGFRNEFNTMEALINKLPKDTITGKKKYKSFKLGISDNVRAVGSGTFDRYELKMDDFSGRGGETVDAEFDTTKLMATFSITDEAILKGTGDGSLIDVLKDQLSDMEIGMKHTYNRYIYGSHTGRIGELVLDNSKIFDVVTVNEAGSTLSDTATAADKQAYSDAVLDYTRDNRGAYHNMFRYGKAPKVISFKMVNSHSLISGMGALIHYQAGATAAAGDLRIAGFIWQKDNTEIHSERVLFIVQAVYKLTSDNGTLSWVKQDTFTDVVAKSSGTATVYSRQLDETGNIAKEYTGLEDIVVTQNNFIFGVDRNIYRSLNCTAVEMGGNGANGHYVNEEILRDLSDHLALTSPDGTAITLCCANHRIISQVEKALYQFKNYNLTNVGQGMQLGGSYELKFDNYVLYKDKYARDNNLYMLDQTKIGELVRRDFTWITSGEVNGVLQRRPGTEMYEGIMNKYADMYIDAWRCHAVLKHCKVTEPGTFFSYQNNGLPKGIADGATSVQITGVADGVKFPQE